MNEFESKDNKGILIPAVNHKTFRKQATFLNLSSADRKWLAKQGSGYYVLRVVDVWEDKDEYRTNIEGKIMRPKEKAKRKSNDQV